MTGTCKFCGQIIHLVGVQASVTRTAKGNLKINRKDTTAEASEIVA